MTLTTSGETVRAATAPGHHATSVQLGAQGVPGTIPSGDEPLVEEDLLVEDVSIDGMCGVY